jgi:hypothetical protein
VRTRSWSTITEAWSGGITSFRLLGWQELDLRISKLGKPEWRKKEKLGKGTILYADGRFYLRAEDKKGRSR